MGTDHIADLVAHLLSPEEEVRFATTDALLVRHDPIAREALQKIFDPSGPIETQGTIALLLSDLGNPHGRAYLHGCLSSATTEMATFCRRMPRQGKSEEPSVFPAHVPVQHVSWL